MFPQVFLTLECHWCVTLRAQKWRTVIALTDPSARAARILPVSPCVYGVCFAG